MRRGLLTPETNAKGGPNPYQVFTAEHVRAAKFICTAQSLGLSKELAAIGKERQAGRLTPEFSIAILSAQLGKLETRGSRQPEMPHRRLGTLPESRAIRHRSGDARRDRAQ